MNNPEKWINFLCPRPEARVRLFCFPYSGGGVHTYRKWSEELPEFIETCAIQFPGRESRYNEKPFARIEPLVKVVCEALVKYLDRPFAFFGHSLGALVCFEVARVLIENCSIYPKQLFVSAFRAPQLPLSYEPVHELPKVELLNIISKLHHTKEKDLFDPQLLELALPTIRADLAVCETYCYQSKQPLPTPIVAYGGLSDARVSRCELDAWREQTQDEFYVKFFQGGHFFLHTNQMEILRDIARILVKIK